MQPYIKNNLQRRQRRSFQRKLIHDSTIPQHKHESYEFITNKNYSTDE